jgi:hypothetical protein
VIPLSLFLTSFSKIFFGKIRENHLTILENLVQEFENLDITFVYKDLKISEIKESTELNSAEIMIRLVVYNFLFKQFTQDEQKFVDLFKPLIPRLCSSSPMNPCELKIILNILTHLIATFEDKVKFCFSDVWQFISSQVLCIGHCSTYFEKLDDQCYQVCFELIHQLLTHFSDNRMFIFQCLLDLLSDNEHISLFMTRSIKELDVSDSTMMIRSQNLLQNTVLGEFWESIYQDPITSSGNDEKEDDLTTCGLVNLGSTCYFNSLIQQFANMKWFVNLMFTYCSKYSNFNYIPKVDDGKHMTFFLNFSRK